MKMTVTQIQRFCMHDGPGVRTTVFLKGCSMRCAWCHNPETQREEPQILLYASKCIGCGVCTAVCPTRAHKITSEGHVFQRKKCLACGACSKACPTGALELCGKEYSAREILDIVEKDRAFYGETGGITLSGGEPLVQPAACIELLRLCKEQGLSTAVETCGCFDSGVLESIVPNTDLFLWDIKDTDPERHKHYTGVSNEKILQNLKKADDMGAAIRMRCILVNGVNTNAKHYREIAELASSLSHLEGVEFFAYHAYGGSKATFLGLPDNGCVDWIPSEAQINEAKQMVRSFGFSVL